MSKLRVCQSRIHEWGRKNRVSFDPAKEAFVILHPRYGVGATFKLLGLMVDTRLSMEEAVHAILQKARPKMRALLRTRGHYNVKDMFMQYKTHILVLLEANTGGIYHATDTTLGALDRFQRAFVNNFNMSEECAFHNFNLAPLCLRRDIAMLGFLHKRNLPDAHDDMIVLFPPRRGRPNGGHDKQMWNILTMQSENTFQTELARRSIFSLVHVYNAVPQRIVNCSSVSDFQRDLTNVARIKLDLQHANWHTFLSPRHFVSSQLLFGL